MEQTISTTPKLFVTSIVENKDELEEVKTFYMLFILKGMKAAIMNCFNNVCDCGASSSHFRGLFEHVEQYILKKRNVTCFNLDLHNSI